MHFLSLLMRKCIWYFTSPQCLISFDECFYSLISNECVSVCNEINSLEVNYVLRLLSFASEFITDVSLSSPLPLLYPLQHLFYAKLPSKDTANFSFSKACTHLHSFYGERKTNSMEKQDKYVELKCNERSSKSCNFNFKMD